MFLLIDINISVLIFPGYFERTIFTFDQPNVPTKFDSLAKTTTQN